MTTSMHPATSSGRWMTTQGRSNSILGPPPSASLPPIPSSSTRAHTPYATDTNADETRLEAPFSTSMDSTHPYAASSVDSSTTLESPFQSASTSSRHAPQPSQSSQSSSLRSPRVHNTSATTPPSSARATSSKSVLAIALQKAQSAVLLDSANNIPAAVAAYTQAIRLLQDIMARVEDSAVNWRDREAARLKVQGYDFDNETEEDKRERLKREARLERRERARIDEGKRLKVIHDTYVERIRKLTSDEGDDVDQSDEGEMSDLGESLVASTSYSGSGPDATYRHRRISNATTHRSSMATITPSHVQNLPREQQIRSSPGKVARSSPWNPAPVTEQSDDEVAAEGIGAAFLNAPSSPTITMTGPGDVDADKSSLTGDDASGSSSLSMLGPDDRSATPERSLANYRLEVAISESPAFEAVAKMPMESDLVDISEPTSFMDSDETDEASDSYTHPYARSSNKPPRQGLPSPPYGDADNDSEEDTGQTVLVKPAESRSSTEQTPKAETSKSVASFLSSDTGSPSLLPPAFGLGRPGQHPYSNPPKSASVSVSSIESGPPSTTSPVLNPPSRLQPKRRPSIADSILQLPSLSRSNTESNTRLTKKSSSFLRSSKKLINPSTKEGTIFQRRKAPTDPMTGMDAMLSTSSRPSMDETLAGENLFDDLGRPVPPMSAQPRTQQFNSLPQRLRAASQPGKRPNLPPQEEMPRMQAYRSISTSAHGNKSTTSLLSSPTVDRSQSISPMIGDTTLDSPTLNQFPVIVPSQYPSVEAHSALSATLPPRVPSDLFLAVSAARRPYQLMHRLLLSIQQGSYVTPKLMVTKAAWQSVSSKLVFLETKVKCIDLLLAGLEGIDRAGEVLLVARAVDQPIACRTASERLAKELDSFDSLLDSVQGTLSKKLGFIDQVNGRKGQNALVGMWQSKISKSFDRMTNTKSGDAQAIYVDALQRLFHEVQLLDRHLALLSGETQPSPYPSLAAPVRQHIELKLKRTSDFWSQVVLRFVLQDVGVLLEKQSKRVTTWAME